MIQTHMTRLEWIKCLMSV